MVRHPGPTTWISPALQVHYLDIFEGPLLILSNPGPICEGWVQPNLNLNIQDLVPQYYILALINTNIYVK